jgi:hypothetical protein
MRFRRVMFVCQLFIGVLVLPDSCLLECLSCLTAVYWSACLVSQLFIGVLGQLLITAIGTC